MIPFPSSVYRLSIARTPHPVVRFLILIVNSRHESAAHFGGAYHFDTRLQISMQLSNACGYIEGRVIRPQIPSLFDNVVNALTARRNPPLSTPNRLCCRVFRNWGSLWLRERICNPFMSPFTLARDFRSSTFRKKTLLRLGRRPAS
jgi:hypothetical protein